jgi:hypothetical protein
LLEYDKAMRGQGRVRSVRYVLGGQGGPDAGATLLDLCVQAWRAEWCHICNWCWVVKWKSFGWYEGLSTKLPETHDRTSIAFAYLFPMIPSNPGYRVYVVIVSIT